VGAGFSFTDEKSGYCTNSKDCVGDNLVSLMVQFYKIFPAVRSSDLYITGESYGGHYVPAFGAKIVEHNADPSNTPIPLKGVAIGDGWIDPVNMIPGYPGLMKNLALATDAEVAVIQDYCDRSVSFIKQGKMTDAFNVWDEMLNGDIYPYPNYFHNITGSNNYDNLDMTNNPPDEGYFSQYLNQPEIRKAIHVGDTCFGCNAGTCEKHLMGDFHVSLRPELELILKSSGMKVLVYSGQLDIIIASALTERFLPYLEWPSAKAFAAAPKKVWRVEGTDAEVAGFVREVPGFQRVIVRGAGHIVPFDQPRRSLDMITHFVEGSVYISQIDPVKAATSIVV
jgi:vitellogenic carboxypeptidase-like protein